MSTAVTVRPVVFAVFTFSAAVDMPFSEESMHSLVVFSFCTPKSGRTSSVRHTVAMLGWVEPHLSQYRQLVFHRDFGREYTPQTCTVSAFHG